MEHASRAGAQEDNGFTMIEMVVALTIMAFVLMSMASVQFGSLKALAASRQRSAFVEIGNSVMEQLRSLPESQVGVSPTDPNLATAYPANKYKGLDAVLVSAGPPSPPLAVETVTSSDVKGIVVPYTVRRWVTTDPGGTGDDLRRLEVRIEWSENRRSARSLTLTSVWYPGGIGSETVGNQPPVITSATVTPLGASYSTPRTFSVVATDPDGDALDYSWQFGDGSTATGATAVHVYATGGTYSALVIVRDPARGQRTASLSVTVANTANVAPTAQFAITSATGGSAPFTVNVSGQGSSDPDGDNLAYGWDWGDGTTGSGVNAGHTYNAAGSYQIALTVTDTAGATSTTPTQNVNVGGGCSILSASFRNPGTNAVTNDIRVNSSSNTKPMNNQFEFTATTNLYCPNVLWALQTSNPNPNFRYEVTATSGVTSGGYKVWTITSAAPNSIQFPLGALLTGFASSSGSSFSFTFNAHV